MYFFLRACQVFISNYLITVYLPVTSQPRGIKMYLCFHHQLLALLALLALPVETDGYMLAVC